MPRFYVCFDNCYLFSLLHKRKEIMMYNPTLCIVSFKILMCILLYYLYISWYFTLFPVNTFLAISHVMAQVLTLNTIVRFFLYFEYFFKIFVKFRRVKFHEYLEEKCPVFGLCCLTNLIVSSISCMSISIYHVFIEWKFSLVIAFRKILYFMNYCK